MSPSKSARLFRRAKQRQYEINRAQRRRTSIIFKPAIGEQLQKFAELYDVIPRANESDDALRKRVLSAARGDRKTIFGTGHELNPRLVEALVSEA